MMKIKMRNHSVAIIILFLFCNSSFAQDDQPKLKHYMLVGEVHSSGLKAIIDNPADMAVNYGKELEALGGQLVDYYFVAGSAKMFVIIQLPDTVSAAAHVYQRSSTGVMKVVELIEIIPSNDMTGVLKKAKEFDNIFKQKGNASSNN
jgi:uncharacterized protein with GYD domain